MCFATLEPYTLQNLLFSFNHRIDRFSVPANSSFLTACNELRAFYRIDANVFFDELKSSGVEVDPGVVDEYKKFIEEERDRLLHNIFRVLSRLKGQVKALSPPLQLIPKSLHLVESFSPLTGYLLPPFLFPSAQHRS